MYQVGDTVQLIGTTDQYVVKAVDPHFEGEREAVGIWLYETQAIEWVSATLVEKVNPVRIPPGYGVSSALHPPF